MIIAKLMGGLGNQMFQYAAAVGIAEKLGTAVAIDKSWFDTAVDVDTPRRYELDGFALQQAFVNPERLTLVSDRNKTAKTKLYDLTKGRIKPRVLVYKESGHGFDSRVLKLQNNTLLDGFWQTEKYFAHARNKLLEDFEFTNPPSSKNQQLLRDISGSNAISLHVRRGDYANNANTNAFHGLTGLDYYKAAVAKIAKQVKDPTFFVFSDDPEWCKQNLKIDFPSTYVSHNKDGIEDMRLMTHCQHHIIANSSFSWWGAWLNPNPDKIVIAPKKWFNDTSMDTKDILPEEWIKL
ncbi:MAG: alpha-1,2-fucosyltransferase [Patescibacteria group bacterium]